MKYRFVFLIYLFCVVILPSAHGASKSPVSKKPAIPIFAGSTPHPHAIVKDIEAKSRSYAVLLSKMKQKTKKLNGDAVIHFSIDYETKGDIIFGGSKVNFIGKGVAIRWEDPAVKSLLKESATKTLKKGLSCKKVEIPVFETAATPKPFIIIGKTFASGPDPKKSLCNLKREAVKFEGDAIIDYVLKQQNFTIGGGVSILGGIGGTASSSKHAEIKNIANGIIVRWAKPEEKGIMNLSGADKIEIPILE